jgi:ribosomal-protein-serine acetyltransferase
MFSYRVDKEISLKLLEKKDAKEVFPVVNKNREYLRKWLPWVDETKSVEDYYPVIDMWLKQFVENNGFQVGIYYKESYVGMIGFHGVDNRNKQTSIGYWLAEGYQGKGIMTRCCQVLLKHAFETLQLNRVEIRCAEGNKKSRAIPERLGFTQEGIIRDGELLYDHYVNSVVYSMLAREWHNL